MRHPRFKLAVLFAVLLLVPGAVDPPDAQATFPVFDASNFTQNVRTAVAQLRALEQRLQMIRNQIDQYRWMLDQIRPLKDPTLRDLTRLLGDIDRLLRRTRGLLYNHPEADEKFKKTYPAFEASEDLRADEMKRAETTLETLRATLLATRRMGKTFRPSQGTLARMKAQALGAQGHLEAYQAQAVLTSFVAEEVGKLLQQQAVHSNAQTVYAAYRLSTEVAAAETHRKAMLSTHRDVGPYEATEPLPVVPGSIAGGER